MFSSALVQFLGNVGCRSAILLSSALASLRVDTQICGPQYRYYLNVLPDHGRDSIVAQPCSLDCPLVMVGFGIDLSYEPQSALSELSHAVINLQLHAHELDLSSESWSEGG